MGATGGASGGRSGGRAWDPVLAGLILDAVDFATFGPVGLQLGFLAGAAAAWLLTRNASFQPRTRLLVMAASGVYCMMPFTSFVPAATVVGAAIRWLAPPQPVSPRTDSHESGQKGEAVDAEFRRLNGPDAPEDPDR